MKMYTAEDVSKICSCSKAKAYNIIRSLNNILIKNGDKSKTFNHKKEREETFIISGKISKKFFHEMLKI